jgi:hypothetical protein
MTINASKLQTALRRKFGNNRKAVFAALGLDADVFGSGAGTSENAGNGNGDKPELNGACFHLIQEHLKNVLDAHQLAELTQRLKNFMLAPTADADQQVGSQSKDADDPPELEKFREHLRNKNLDWDDGTLDHAVGLARDYMKHRRANGADRMPVSAVTGILHGHMSGKSRDDLAEARRNMRMIEGEPGRDRRRGAMDAAPSRATRGRFNARYPDARRFDSDPNIPVVDIRSNAEKKFGLDRIGI